MGDQCGAPEVYDSSDEYNREDRIETYYQGWGAREMAERIVELEDELGADVDGICTGMHADVAEAHAEVERLQGQFKTAQEAVKVAMRWLRDADFERDRYRLAWLSARRRAADEHVFGMEALQMRDDEIRRLKAELEASRKTTHAPRLEHVGGDEDGPVYKLAESPASHPAPITT
ncbi:hypothetical protein [Streptomyces sp. MH60]|uniref:hypothetical protein n=1 Tax=Streptomyces sp. MH60 TaxID=1940758 RepID=UPI000CEE37AA|nr:hypothetical protein [Streptomyces sp. MH60]PPS86446.1 hypothetical protein BZZ08_03413 [Streptomyces sp. MH60]